MAYNQELADRIREKLAQYDNISEKEMFGGIAFMYHEKMCVGVIKEDMMCRIDPAIQDECFEKQGCRPMDFSKRPMKGYIYIDQSGMQSQKDFEYWIHLAIDYNKYAKSSKKKKTS